MKIDDQNPGSTGTEYVVGAQPVVGYPGTVTAVLMTSQHTGHHAQADKLGCGALRYRADWRRQGGTFSCSSVARGSWRCSIWPKTKPRYHFPLSPAPSKPSAPAIQTRFPADAGSDLNHPRSTGARIRFRPRGQDMVTAVRSPASSPCGQQFPVASRRCTIDHRPAT